MKIIHRISLSASENDRREFQRAGVDLPAGFATVEIREDDPRWEMVKSLVERRRAVDVVHTRFTKAEIEEALYLQMLPTWHYGYPQPDNDFGYLNETYDLSDYCSSCGTGLRQVAPFLLKRPPAWGNRAICQLNWVFDEYLTTPDLWSGVFRPLGIGSWPVLQEKTASILDSVVQLKIASSFPLQLSDEPYSECPECCRRKYAPLSRGSPPAPICAQGEIFRSEQYFGSGASAYRAILISQHIREVLIELGVKGVSFRPCRGPTKP